MLGISDGIYEGIDYIPHCYNSWIDEEPAEPKRRRNLVMVSKSEPDRVLGFQSFLFMVKLHTKSHASNKHKCLQNEQTLAINQAVRVDPAVRGQRLGKTMMTLGEDLLRELNPEMQQLKIVYTGIVPEKVFKDDPFMGRLVSDRPSVIMERVEASGSLRSIGWRSIIATALR